MSKALIIIGVFSITGLIAGIIMYVTAKFILWYFEPEPDSNEALRNWLISHPGMDIDDYLHNKKDRCTLV